MKKKPAEVVLASNTMRPARDGRRPSSSTKLSPGEKSTPKAPLTVTREELLIDGGDFAFRTLVQNLLTFLSIHAAIRDGYASLLDLPGPRYTILLCIRKLGDTGPVNITTAADNLRLSGSYITTETKALEQMGLVRKERGSVDRRTVSLSVTAKGVAVLDSITALRQRINDIEFGCLSKSEFQFLVPIVEHLIQTSERALAMQQFLATHGAPDGDAQIRAA